MTPDTHKHALGFLRHRFDSTQNWYKSAETKAQLVLTLNGVFIGFIGKNVFLNEKTTELLQTISFSAQAVVGIMLMCIAASIIFALLCVRTRFVKLDLQKYAQYDEKGNVEKYDERFIFFFGFLGQMKSDVLIKQLEKFGPSEEFKILAHNIVIFSKNVAAKHRMVNISFLLFGCSLILFIVSIFAHQVF